MRPQVMLLPMIIYLCVVVSTSGFGVSKIILGILLTIMTYGITAVQNDLSDQNIDRLNKRSDIPLATKSVTPAELQWLLLALTIAATAIATMLGRPVLLWVVAYTLFGWLYSGMPNFKSRSYLALLTLGICYGAMPWVLALLVVDATLSWDIVALVSSSTIFSVGIITLKDFKDETGDRAGGKRTLLVGRGKAYVRGFMLIVTTLAYAGLALLLVKGSDSVVLTLLCLLAAILNILLIGKQEVATSVKLRHRNGTIARCMFYGLCLATYVSLLD